MGALMPANAGIQVPFFEFKFETRLDSGFRRNDRNKSRLPVDNPCRLRAEGRSVPLFLCTQLAHMRNQAVDLLRVKLPLNGGILFLPLLIASANCVSDWLWT